MCTTHADHVHITYYYVLISFWPCTLKWPSHVLPVHHFFCYAVYILQCMLRTPQGCGSVVLFTFFGRFCEVCLVNHTFSLRISKSIAPMVWMPGLLVQMSTWSAQTMCMHCYNLTNLQTPCIVLVGSQLGRPSSETSTWTIWACIKIIEMAS